LKEKKPTLTEALAQTLQAMHTAGCLNLADIIEGKFAIHSKYFHILINSVQLFEP
jgi:cytoskeleton-associated protein 5